MSLKLVFLGRLEDAAGLGERAVAYAATIDGVLAALDPMLAETLRGPRVRIALNGTLVGDPGAATIADGDELAFLPPVSGG